MERIFGLAKLILLALLLFCFIARLIILLLHKQRTGEELALKPFGWYQKIFIYSIGGKRRKSVLKRANFLNTTFWILVALLLAVQLLSGFF